MEVLHMDLVFDIIYAVIGLVVLISFFLITTRLGKIAKTTALLCKYEQAKLIDAGLYDPTSGCFTKIEFDEFGTVTVIDSWVCNKCHAFNKGKHKYCQACAAARPVKEKGAV
jgi:hypothetical protein